jgi:SAM-dependent methyltransferase
MRPDVGRPPTSHERMSGQPWDASYYDGPAPWDVGRPQPAVARLALEGRFSGSVLDAGCGTGENTLLVAALGLPVLGVDVAETALSMAREKAAERGVAAEFAWADALRLDRLERRFDTVLDCGLFHSFDGDERPRREPLRALLQRRRIRYRPAPGQPGRAGRAVRPRQWLERRRHRPGPGAHPLPR